AQTGMKFLAVGASARQSALADAFTAADGSSSSLFYNPAGMARLQSFADATFSTTEWIAEIKHQFGSIALSPFSGEYGVIGISFQYVDYGEIQATILANNTQGFLDVGTFKPTAYAVGVGYARALSDKFSVGGDVRWIKQDLGSGITEATFTSTGGQADGYSPVTTIDNTLGVYAFDFGIIYRTGFRSLNFGMTIRNFSREVKYQKESFQLPLTFKIGLSMNMLDLIEEDPNVHSLLVLADAEHPRDYPEEIRLGMEYTFQQMLAVRLGYVYVGDEITRKEAEYSMSYGIGLRQSFAGTQFALDYSYTPFGVFDKVQRFSVQFGF
ncbi:MAG TPA: PorV/PorQ family protein, partial [Bacteroidota bacterium]|nr:PorV/PorQ family protein [Bacteroidota bacterium]